MGSRKNRWRITFYRTPTPPILQLLEPPNEFICPISGSLMADPVLVTSGQTLERNCVQACKDLNFIPNGSISKLDFSAVISNVAIQSTILKWCDTHGVDHPKEPEKSVAEKIVRALMGSSQNEVSKSTELVKPVNGSELNQLLSSSSSSISSLSETVEYETLMPNWPEEEEEIFLKLKSNQVFDQEEALMYLRKITRMNQETRIPLCSSRILLVLRTLVISRYSSIQINSVAVLVNLSLENINKVKIVRSGLLLPLVNAMKYGFEEAQEHAVGAIFSLALEDENKTAIGVLGALPPLILFLRSEKERVRCDAGLALYHLSFDQSNRSKLVKLGVVLVLLANRDVRNVRILSNLAMCSEGCIAMLEAGAVKYFFEILKGHESDSRVNTAICVAILYALSSRTLRFKMLAKEAGGEDILMGLMGCGQDKAEKMLELIRAKERQEEDEEMDWESLLNSSTSVSRSEDEKPKPVPKEKPVEKIIESRKEKEVRKKEDSRREKGVRKQEDKEADLVSLLYSRS